MAERVEVTLDGLLAVRQRIGRREPEPGDWVPFDALVAKLMAHTERRRARILAKLNADVAGSASDEATSAASHKEDAGQDVNSPHSHTPPPQMQGPCGPEDRAGNVPSEKPDPEKPKGHGRQGASAYTNAEHALHALTPDVVGATCERCQRGKMYRYRQKVRIYVVGQPMFGVEAHHYEQARCRACGRVIQADGPVHVHEGIGSDYVRYDWSACAMLMVMHYFGGAPFKRLESLHRGWGVPMSDANQWQVVSAGDDHILPLYKALEEHAIQKVTNFRVDDTGGKVLSLSKKIDDEIADRRLRGESTKDVRTGINATGFYWETPNGPIITYHTGLLHAGEIVDRLLARHLLSSPKLVKCTDGASKNFDHEQGDKLFEATCNAHALLKFRAVKDKHPPDYAEVASLYKQVFDNDDDAKALGLSPVDRMLYHRAHSKPLMEALKNLCKDKLESRLVEPSAPLWEPLTFIVNQWERLSLFCLVPGVPLDTNLVEQALIMPVRYLAGSFNYKTEDGAIVGDHVMSLVATARANEIEPVAYLTECLRCHEDLAERPDRYLPWVYRERLRRAKSRPPRDEESLLAKPWAAPSESPGRLRESPPDFRERAALRVAAPDQDLQLAGEQR